VGERRGFSRHLVLGFGLGFMACFAVSPLLIVQYELFSSFSVSEFLLIFSIFLLNGSLKRKIVAFLVGSTLGLLWNVLLYTFTSSIANFFGFSINLISLIINPLLGILWLVSFYPLSLTFICGSERRSSAGAR